MKTRLQHLLQLMPHDVLSFFGCICVIIGIFFSRALMSIGMMTLIGNALLDIRLAEKFKSFIKQPHLVLLTLYFFIFLLSGLWSDDIHYFKERMQIMLPFLVLPFSFHAMSKPDVKWMDFMFLFFIALSIGGMSWSLYQYMQHKDLFDLGYHLSHVIPTPFKNDHIRFSLAVVLSICLGVDLFARHENPVFRSSMILVVLFCIIYLHILSAKTGLVAFYLISILFLFKLIFHKKYRKAGSLFLLVLIALPFIMYAVSPSFRNKIGYVNYSISKIQNDQIDPNISDEGRIISYKYAIRSISANPLIGVGVGDVFQTMTSYYHEDFGDQEVHPILPHNQFLMAGMALGIGGILYLLILQGLLFRLSFKHDFLYFAFWCMMFLAMMIEPLYETQFGTCMFLFFLLLLLQRRTRAE